MSAQIAAESVTGEPAAMAAAVQRVQQLQTLIAQAQQAWSSSTSISTSTSFAAELAQAEASAPDTPSLQGSAGVPTATGAVAAPAGSEGSQAYEGLIDQAAERYGIDPALLDGLIEQESGFDPSARSSAGALGLTQLMPQTAASLGVTEPLDPTQSIEGGARYLSQLLRQFGGNTEDAIAAYNAGPGAVSEYGGIPPYAETQSYVSNVLANADAYAHDRSDVAETGGTA